VDSTLQNSGLVSVVMRVVACLLASATLSSALRNVKSRTNFTKSRLNASSSVPVVDALYTWGAPAVIDKAFLANPRSPDGCWKGRRIVTLRTQTSTGIWDVDAVNGITNAVGYWHAKQPTIKVDEKGHGLYHYPCGNDASNGIEVPVVSLHLPDLYDRVAAHLSGEDRLMTRLAVLSSYSRKAQAASIVRTVGWRLVGSSLWDGKETYLIQHPDTLKCVMTFQGTTTSRVLDWWDNLRIYAGSYCGLPNRVHAGFRDQLRAVTESSGFQSDIKAKMGKCRTLTVAGHSLGGAMAAMYSACVNNAPSGDSDYGHVKWTLQTPALLKPIA